MGYLLTVTTVYESSHDVEGRHDTVAPFLPILFITQHVSRESCEPLLINLLNENMNAIQFKW